MDSHSHSYSYGYGYDDREANGEQSNEYYNRVGAYANGEPNINAFHEGDYHENHYFYQNGFEGEYDYQTMEQPISSAQQTGIQSFGNGQHNFENYGQQVPESFSEYEASSSSTVQTLNYEDERFATPRMNAPKMKTSQGPVVTRRRSFQHGRRAQPMVSRSWSFSSQDSYGSREETNQYHARESILARKIHHASSSPIVDMRSQNSSRTVFTNQFDNTSTGSASSYEEARNGLAHGFTHEYASINNQLEHDYNANHEVLDIFSLTRHNRYHQVEALLDQGVPVDVRDRYGNTILIVACQNGLKRIAKLALRRGANINAQNKNGNTSLHYCFGLQYGETLGTYLISKGANPNILNKNGQTCYQGFSERGVPG